MRILVLSRNGSLYSTNRLVRSARARGHDIDVVDPLELQLVVAKGRATLALAGSPLPVYHAVIPRIGASITRYGLAVVRQFEEAGVVVANGAASIAYAHDKVRTLQLLQRHDLAVPRTVCTRSLAGLPAALDTVGGCPAIVKLLHGSQGIGTMIADTPQAVFSLLETLWAMGQEIVLQEYIRESGGRDVRAFVVGGKVVAAMRRVARPGEFRSNLHRGGRGDPLLLPASYRRLATRAARVAGLEICGVDLLEGKKGPLVVELNSSPGLEGIEQATGIDVAHSIVARVETLWRKRRRAGRVAAPRLEPLH
ncbi:MAG: RimK family alpha-L-glutamate ligase [Myxococcales bacterium]|nr:RimK family alpha-L-glutamate ligase [Myxococcales bacterium]